jgi:hypothetical protein
MIDIPADALGNPSSRRRQPKLENGMFDYECTCRKLRSLDHSA